MSLLSSLAKSHPDLLNQADAVSIVAKKLYSGNNLEEMMGPNWSGNDREQEVLGAYASEVSCLLIQVRRHVAKLQPLENKNLDATIRIKRGREIVSLLSDYIRELKDLMYFRSMIPVGSDYRKVN